MKKQGANLFDHGLNLDNDPITIDNHTLTGALNATMVTKNGNELVLQNDMGNAKVDLALLPSGYVPVGMKEHGGIIYVASYNPIEGKCQIGSFPSPQRNFPSDENGRGFRLAELWDFVDLGVKKPWDKNVAVERTGRYYIDYNGNAIAINVDRCARWLPVYTSNAEYHPTQSYYIDNNTTYVYEPNPDFSTTTNTYWIYTFPNYIPVTDVSAGVLDPNITYYRYNVIQRTYTEVRNPELSQLRFYYVSSDLIYTNTGNWIDNTYRYVTLIGDNDDDIIRTGDSFLINSNNAELLNDVANPNNPNDNLIRLQAMILASDNTSVDITPDLVQIDNPSYTYSNFPFLGKNFDIYTGNKDLYYSIHKNKVSGKLILKESLVLPSSINVSIKAVQTANPNQVQLKFKPTAYDENGNIWTANNVEGYAIRINHINSVNESNDFQEFIYPGDFDSNGYIIFPNNTDIYNMDDVITYEVYPMYNYHRRIQQTEYAKVRSLGRTNTIRVADVGSGRVDFGGYFKYYNNIDSDRFQLDYVINAYIDDSDYVLNRLYLQLFDIEDLHIDLNAREIKNPEYVNNISVDDDLYRIEVPLPIDNYFGNVSFLVNYDSNTLPSSSRNYPAENIDKGHYYIGRIVAKVEDATIPGSETTYKSEWYAIITSTITNEDYGNTAILVMYQMKDASSNKEFLLDYELLFERELISSSHSEDEVGDISSITRDYTQFNRTTPGFDPENPTVSRRLAFKAVTESTGARTYQHTTTLKYPLSFHNTARIWLPFTIEDEHDIPSLTACSAYRETVPLYGNYLVVVPSTMLRDLTVNPNRGIWLGFRYLLDSNPFWSSGFDSPTGDMTFRYNIRSYLWLQLTPNMLNLSASTSEERHRHHELRTGEAFVPYAPFYYTPQSLEILENSLGPVQELHTEYWDDNAWRWIEDNPCEYNHNYNNKIRPKRKLIYRKAVKRDGSSSISYNKVGLVDGTFRCGWDDLGYDRGDPANYTGISYTTGSPRWEDLRIQNALQDLSINTSLLMWEGVGAITCSLRSAGTRREGYAIPMLRGIDDCFYPIDLFWASGDDPDGAFRTIIKNFNSIYVCQPGRKIEFDYYKGSNDPDRFCYTEPYTAQINYTIRYLKDPSTCILKMRDDNTTSSNFSNYNRSGNIITLFGEQNYRLPLFKNKNVDESLKYEDLYDSPDQSVRNAQMLDPSLADDITGAIIIDREGETYVDHAYEYHDPINTRNLPNKVEFDKEHVYLHVEGCGSKAILIDCMDPNNNLRFIKEHRTTGQFALESYSSYLRKQFVSDIFKRSYLGNDPTLQVDTYRNNDPNNYYLVGYYGNNMSQLLVFEIGRFGVNIAKAISKEMIVKRRDSNSGWNYLLINPSRCSDIVSCYSYGGSASYSSDGSLDYFNIAPISSIAKIKNLPLFDDNFIDRATSEVATTPFSNHNRAINMWALPKVSINWQTPFDVPVYENYGQTIIGYVDASDNNAPIWHWCNVTALRDADNHITGYTYSTYDRRLFQFSGFNGSYKRAVTRFNDTTYVIVHPAFLGLQMNNIYDAIWDETIPMNSGFLWPAGNSNPGLYIAQQ